jgi:hypothetical protein
MDQNEMDAKRASLWQWEDALKEREADLKKQQKVVYDFLHSLQKLAPLIIEISPNESRDGMAGFVAKSPTGQIVSREEVEVAWLYNQGYDPSEYYHGMAYRTVIKYWENLFQEAYNWVFGLDVVEWPPNELPSFTFADPTLGPPIGPKINIIQSRYPRAIDPEWKEVPMYRDISEMNEVSQIVKFKKRNKKI